MKTPKTKKYRAALVGCGAMGIRNYFEKSIPYAYSFVGTILANKRTELVGLMDLDEEKVQTYGTAFKVASFTDLTRMFDETRPDIVFCAAGPNVNANVIREAFRRKIKGVYCEKPLCTSLETGDELAELERKSKTKVQVNYLRNFDLFHNQVLNSVRTNSIGNLQVVRVLYNGGVNAVFPHSTALLGKLFDGAVQVSGIYSPIKNISTEHDPNIDGTIRFRFEPQSRDVNVQFAATGRGKDENNIYIFEIEMTGSKGKIRLLNCGFDVKYEKMRLSPVFGKAIGENWPYECKRTPKGINPKVKPISNPMVEGLERLIKAIENDTPTLCNVSYSRDTEEISHALAISAENDGGIVQLPLKDEQKHHIFKESFAGVDLLKRQCK